MDDSGLFGQFGGFRDGSGQSNSTRQERPDASVRPEIRASYGMGMRVAGHTGHSG